LCGRFNEDPGEYTQRCFAKINQAGEPMRLVALGARTGALLEDEVITVGQTLFMPSAAAHITAREGRASHPQQMEPPRVSLDAPGAGNCAA
jgi:hypothetical protein